MRLSIALVVVVVGLLGLFSSSVNAATCDKLFTCLQCATNTSCGWCNSLDACVPGDPNGAFGLCPSGWAWTQQDCADPCLTYSSCKTCNINSQCGWCQGLSTCKTGSLQGPNSGVCPSWSFNAGCVICDLYLTCGSCLAAPGCGWCDSAQMCMQGNVNMTNAASGLCGNFTGSPSGCPTSISLSPISIAVAVLLPAGFGLLILGIHIAKCCGWFGMQMDPSESEDQKPVEKPKRSLYRFRPLTKAKPTVENPEVAL